MIISHYSLLIINKLFCSISERYFNSIYQEKRVKITHCTELIWSLMYVRLYASVVRLLKCTEAYDFIWLSESQKLFPHLALSFSGPRLLNKYEVPLPEITKIWISKCHFKCTVSLLQINGTQYVVRINFKSGHFEIEICQICLFGQNYPSYRIILDIGKSRSFSRKAVWTDIRY